MTRTLHQARHREAAAAGRGFAAAVALTGVLAGAPRAALGQGSPPPAAPGRAAGLTLDDVLRTTVALNPAGQVARRQVDAARGASTAAAAPFDAQFRSSIAGGRRADPTFVPASADVTSTLTRSVDYQLGVERRLRWGVVVTPQVGLAQQELSPGAPLPVTRATAGLTVAMPLGRDRLGRALAATERAAELELDAAELDLRHAVAQAAYEAGVAYWNYAAAQQRLGVQRETEQRAALLVEETQALIRADERPAADLAQLRGNLATRRAQRIAAEQAVVEARQQLGVVMGVPAHEIAALPPAATAYPEPPAAAANAPEPGGVAAGIAGVVDRRPDVLAAAARRRAAHEQVAAAAHQGRPQFDLVAGASYAGVDRGSGVGRFVGPLYRNLSGLNATVQLQYAIPVGNTAARGLAAQREALYEQRRIAEADAGRRAAAAVAVAASGLARGQLGLAEAIEAVGLARETVENERQKFRLGVSTQIDVIYAEDALTSALLAEIAARRGYAAAVAALRFAAGDLTAAERAAALLQTTPTSPDAAAANPGAAEPSPPPRPPRRAP